MNITHMEFGIYSNRGLPLVVQGGEEQGDLLTVELYQKWYSLWRVFKDSTPIEVQFSALEAFAKEGQSAYVDHVPNPVVVRAYAEYHNLYLPTLAEELIEGRWALNVVDNRYESKYLR